MGIDFKSIPLGSRGLLGFTCKDFLEANVHVLPFTTALPLRCCYDYQACLYALMK